MNGSVSWFIIFVIHVCCRDKMNIKDLKNLVIGESKRTKQMDDLDNLQAE